MNSPTPKPFHGGQLELAKQATGLLDKPWLDLSTGVNPHPWPVPMPLPPELFQRLPEQQQHLMSVACEYYFAGISAEQRPGLLAIAGSQWFIERFPAIFKRQLGKNTHDFSVSCPEPGYQEHAYWWHQQGASIISYNPKTLAPLLNKPIATDVMVIINPQNPLCTQIKGEQILAAAQANPECRFIIDEAFIDTQPQVSVLAALRGQPIPANIWLLRSMGKFFGLAGIRVGFVIANEQNIAALNQHQGPWPLTSVSEWIAIGALQDLAWQQQSKHWLIKQSRALLATLQQQLMQLPAKQQPLAFYESDFFICLEFARAEQAAYLHQQLLKQAVLTRLPEKAPLLRIGLPSVSELDDFAVRLQTALQ